jgi:hypothetical protein
VRSRAVGGSRGFLIVAGRDSQQDLIEHVSAEGATRPFKVSPLSRRAAATVIYMELSDGQHSQLGGFFGIPVLLARAIVAWGAQHETHGRQPRESQPACGSSAWLPSMPTAVQCSTNVPLCQRLTRSRISYTRLKRFSIGLVKESTRLRFSSNPGLNHGQNLICTRSHLGSHLTSFVARHYFWRVRSNQMII